jgi:SAM-dependent methyltransferase
LTFDAAVSDYERGRTGWPDGVVAGVTATDVLDLAAGTGKLTRILVQHFQNVTAVEPLPGMRALGEQLVPAANWMDGSAEAIPTPDSSFDAAFVAEAYHWFDAVRATSELARVLRPGAQLHVLFTVWDGSFEPGLSDEAQSAVQVVAERTGPAGGPKWMSGAWRSAFDDAFEDFEEHDVPFHHTTDREGVIAYYLSVSSVAARPVEERSALADELRALVPEGPHALSLRARVYSTARR